MIQHQVNGPFPPSVSPCVQAGSLPPNHPSSHHHHHHRHHNHSHFGNMSSSSQGVRPRGRRQRLAAVAAAPLDEAAAPLPLPSVKLDGGKFDSDLSRLLASQWSWGLISATTLQSIAHAAYQDEQRLLQRLSTQVKYGEIVIGSKSLKDFAALGNFGRQPGNIARDLETLLGEPISAPVFKINLPTKILKPGFRKGSVSEISHSIMLPHVIFSTLYHLNRTMFNQVFLERNQLHLCPRFGTSW